MGNSIQYISDGASIVADDKIWVEDLAIQQLSKTLELPNLKAAVGMPDLHPGKGYPIGAAFLSETRLYPALIGNDIGCGMALFTTSLATHKVKLDKLEKRLGNIEGTPQEYPLWIQEQLHQFDLIDIARRFSLGTIGGGNHFAELQVTDKIYSQNLFADAHLDKKHLHLLVHSGSRGFGEQILAEHLKLYSHQGIEANSDAGQHYLGQHNRALKFAQLNRQLIAIRIAKALSCEMSLRLDVHHNLVEPYTHLGSGWIHLKGATPADKDFVIIPGSRGDYSYLVKPKVSDKSLCSLAHGAGRKWNRKSAKARLSSNYSFEKLQKTQFGSRVICADRQLIYEEAPQAYKPIQPIIQLMQEADLIELVARFKPVITYKTAGKDRC